MAPRSRSDGDPIHDLHPVRRIMPFVMPGRNEAFVLFEQHIDPAPALSFLAQENAQRPGRPTTLFHLVLRAMGFMLVAYPRLNRFVVGNRLYARRGVWLSFSAKQRLTRDAPLFTVKVPFDPTEPLSAMVERVQRALGEGRSGRESATDREIGFFLRLPVPLLRIGTRMVRRLDAWNLLPASFTGPDPLYASAFVANLGSVGLDAAFHHLYEYGTIPIFVTLGRLHRAPVVLADGSVTSQERVTLRYTYDERVEDDFYAARALEHLAGLVADPGRLLAPPDVGADPQSIPPAWKNP